MTSSNLIDGMTTPSPTVSLKSTSYYKEPSPLRHTAHSVGDLFLEVYLPPALLHISPDKTSVIAHICFVRPEVVIRLTCPSSMGSPGCCGSVPFSSLYSMSYFFEDFFGLGRFFCLGNVAESSSPNLHTPDSVYRAKCNAVERICKAARAGINIQVNRVQIRACMVREAQNHILISSSETADGVSTPDSVMIPEMRSGDYIIG
jgi:hypothetical protein